MLQLQKVLSISDITVAKIQRHAEILLDKKPVIKRKLPEDNNIEPEDNNIQSLKEQLESIEKICIIVATNINTYKTN